MRDTLIEGGYAKMVQGKQITKRNIDYALANQSARKIVRKVKVHFIDGFQHAAIDVKIALDIDRVCADTISMPQKDTNDCTNRGPSK